MRISVGKTRPNLIESRSIETNLFKKDFLFEWLLRAERTTGECAMKAWSTRCAVLVGRLIVTVRPGHGQLWKLVDRASVSEQPTSRKKFSACAQLQSQWLPNQSAKRTRSEFRRLNKQSLTRTRTRTLFRSMQTPIRRPQWRTNEYDANEYDRKGRKRWWWLCYWW